MADPISPVDAALAARRAKRATAASPVDAALAARKAAREAATNTLPQPVTLERAEPSAVIFKSAAERDAALQKDRDTYIDQELTKRADRMGAGEEAYNRTVAQVEREAERKFPATSNKIMPAGNDSVENDRTGVIPMFRTTRIEVGADGKRMYRDPSTNELRPATGMDELVEGAARQTIMSEAEARAYGDQVKKKNEDLAVRRAAGENVFWEDVALPAIEDLVQEPVAGKGIVETKLGATLRALPSYLAALAAEGYFAGLGYEVDDQGNPVDPTDVAIEIEKAREKLGLPEAGGGIPLPGFKTQREDRKAFDYDPDAKRSASKLEYRDDTSALSTFASRVGENLARGRTIGDEMMDVPAARESLADTFESPNAAFWAGSIADVVMPAGPGLALSKAKQLGKAAATFKVTSKSATLASKAAGALIKAADVGAEAAELGMRGGRTAQAAQRALDIAADIAAVTTKGAQSEARVIKSVAQRVLDIDPVLTDAQKVVAKGALREAKHIKSTDDAIAVVGNALEAFNKTVTNLPEKEFVQTVIRYGVALTARMPDDLVAVSDSVFVPRGLKNQALKLLNKATKEFLALDDAGKNAKLAAISFPARDESATRALDWAKMSTESRRMAVEAVRLSAAIAEDGIGDLARSAREVTEMQTYLGSLFSKPYLDSLVLRKVRAVLSPTGGLGRLKGIQEVESASLFNLKKTLAAQGNAYTKLLGERLAANAAKFGSYSAALSNEFAIGLKDEKPLSIWTKLLTETYGSRRIEVLLSHLKSLDALGKFNANELPSLEDFKRFDRALISAKLVPSVGWPEYEKVFLKVLAEEGVRKAIIKAGIEGEALTRTLDNIPAFMRNPGSAISRSFDIPGVDSNVARVYDIGESVTEKLVANQAEELVRILPGISVRGRGSLGTLASDIVSQGYMGARNALHGLKYGYVMPNVPYLMGRLMSLPITSLATTGFVNTMRATGRFTENVINEAAQALKMRHAGLGLTTIKGETYNPGVLAALVATRGIGISAVDQLRLSSLADDIERTAKIAAGDKKARIWSAINPAARSFWMRTAEAVENSYRRAMFEGALAAGSTVDEAAELARRSLLDYASTPDSIQNTIGKYLATAASSYQAAAELGNLALKNPGALRAAVKAQSINSRVQDPLGLDGDKALKSIGIFTVGREGDETRYYGPELPIFAPIEEVLGVINAADYAIDKIRDLVVAGVKVFNSDLTPSEMVELGANAAGGFFRAGFEEAFADIVDAYDAWGSADVEDNRATIKTGQVNDTKTFWAALLAADMLKKQGVSGAWDTALSILDPIPVTPPKQYAVGIPGHEQYWSMQPPQGVPYVYKGTTEEGVELFLVYKPSPRGLANLKVIRTLTPAVMERAFGAGVQLLGASIPADVRPDATLPLGVGGAAATFLGESAGPASTDYRKAQAAERIRAQVE